MDTLCPVKMTSVFRRDTIAWALWDWATQPFNTVLITFVWVPSFLTSYFFLSPNLQKQRFLDDGTLVNCSTAASTTSEYCTGLSALAQQLGWGIAIAGLIIALLAPLVGLRADALGHTKRNLAVFTGLLIVAQIAMGFVKPSAEMFGIGVVSVAVALVCVEVANVNYNSLIFRVSTRSSLGKVSGLGWGFGYLGGIIALVAVVVSINIGLLDGRNGFTFQLIAFGAAVWTLIFSIPLFLWVDEPLVTHRTQRFGLFTGYREIVRTIGRLWRESRPTFWFLIASAMYRDGVVSMYTFGSVIAASVFGFSFTELVIFGVFLNVVAGVATILAGRFDDYYGPKTVILLSVGGLILACLLLLVGAPFGKPIIWGVGLLIALLAGPAQSASRSLLAHLAPQDHSGELFGLYATTGRAASWLGPSLWAASIALFANQALYGAIGIMVTLVAGFGVLLLVKTPANVNAQLH